MEQNWTFFHDCPGVCPNIAAEMDIIQKNEQDVLWLNNTPKMVYRSTNSAIEYDLTQMELDELNRILINTGYHGLINNCTTIATGIWNRVVPYDKQVIAEFDDWSDLLTDVNLQANEVDYLLNTIDWKIDTPLMLKEYMDLFMYDDVIHVQMYSFKPYK